MSDDCRKRRSSFFRKPTEESTETKYELFRNMDWVDEEKEHIVSRSVLYGGHGKRALQEYTDELKYRKQEFPKLVANKQEERINLKETLRNKKMEIDWETACEGLTNVEKDFANNRPNYKCLAEKVHELTLRTALVKRAHYELHSTLNAYNRRATEEILKLQEYFIDKIVSDSGVCVSYNDSDVYSSSVESSEEECSNFNEM